MGAWGRESGAGSHGSKTVRLDGEAYAKTCHLGEVCRRAQEAFQVSQAIMNLLISMSYFPYLLHLR